MAPFKMKFGRKKEGVFELRVKIVPYLFGPKAVRKDMKRSLYKPYGR